MIRILILIICVFINVIIISWVSLSVVDHKYYPKNNIRAKRITPYLKDFKSQTIEKENQKEIIDKKQIRKNHISNENIVDEKQNEPEGFNTKIDTFETTDITDDLHTKISKNETVLPEDEEPSDSITMTIPSKIKSEKPVDVFVDVNLIRENYEKNILSKIDKNKIYPPIARRMRHEGRVLVKFNVTTDGSISNLSILQENQFPELNQAALESVKRSSPFEPIPSELQDEKLEIIVWITFILNDN